MFYRSLAGAIRAAKLDGSATWALLGLAFAYGVFHAAGPGHGKAVISSYLVANDETWRRGVVLSFASALLQAVVAVAIVGIAAVLLGMTGSAMGETVRWIEIVSYVLIALIGARLLWVKGGALLRALRASPRDHHHEHDHDHHHHEHPRHEHGDACGHDHASAWGHAHGPEPQDLAGPGGWRRGLSAIVAVGLRPCSGAIIVLVFALAQGIFLTGIVATLAMGFGTALTVTAIALLAVGGRGLATRLAQTKSGGGMILLRALETAAAVLVLAFGVLLLLGYLASEKLPMV
ncbi:MAG: nickel/cobalt transporter [Rhizobiales bacterium]|nr:nickel/cobalt transporter [Hyphomicrobiales bacterium]